MANKNTPKRKKSGGRPRLNHARLECYISADLRARVCAEPNRGAVVEAALRAHYGLAQC